MAEQTPVVAERDSADAIVADGYAPYGQLVKMLLPSAGSTAIYDAQGELVWCSDGYERPDLRGLLESAAEGVNYVNGDYSRGASGFWVECGEIRYPVEEITVAGNLRDMYRNVVAVGNDQVVRGSKVSGSLLIDGMTVGGA